MSDEKIQDELREKSIRESDERIRNEEFEKEDKRKKTILEDTRRIIDESILNEMDIDEQIRLDNQSKEEQFIKDKLVKDDLNNTELDDKKSLNSKQASPAIEDEFYETERVAIDRNQSQLVSEDRKNKIIQEGVKNHTYQPKSDRAKEDKSGEFYDRMVVPDVESMGLSEKNAGIAGANIDQWRPDSIYKATSRDWRNEPLITKIEDSRGDRLGFTRDHGQSVNLYLDKAHINKAYAPELRARLAVDHFSATQTRPDEKMTFLQSENVLPRERHEVPFYEGEQNEAKELEKRGLIDPRLKNHEGRVATEGERFYMEVFKYGIERGVDVRPDGAEQQKLFNHVLDGIERDNQARKELETDIKQGKEDYNPDVEKKMVDSFMSREKPNAKSEGLTSLSLNEKELKDERLPMRLDTDGKVKMMTLGHAGISGVVGIEDSNSLAENNEVVTFGELGPGGTLHIHSSIQDALAQMKSSGDLGRGKASNNAYIIGEPGTSMFRRAMSDLNQKDPNYESHLSPGKNSKLEMDAKLIQADVSRFKLGNSGIQNLYSRAMGQEQSRAPSIGAERDSRSV